MQKLFTLLIGLSFMFPTYAQVSEVTLTFSPVAGGNDVVVQASDQGNGLSPQGEITLIESTEYMLAINLGDDQATFQGRSEEIQFFFSPSVDIFSGSITYADQDNNSLPIGFASEWTTTCLDETSMGNFALQLQDLGNGKSNSSTANDGANVFNLTWPITVNSDPAAPACENEEEIITDVVLTFTPMDGGDVVTARAQDPDGEGVLPLQILDDINLVESTEYRLTVELTNSIEGEDITEEVREEADEHMFFYAFSDDLIRSPEGDGNADNRDDAINYVDFDVNGLPVGLTTDWTTICTEEDLTGGSFRIVLKHQPDIKSATSTITDGGTDVDLTFVMNVANDADAPACENEEEIITDVVLAFTPMDGGDVVTARAQDPDGEGVLPLQILDDINLVESTEYRLTVELTNSIEGEDITEEVREEADEHMFFYAFSDDLIRSPEGDGNADNRDDAINYVDFDGNGLPVGLTTDWTTICTEEDLTGGSFRIVLKHQPGIKSATSTITDGGTDIDLTFVMNVANDADAPACENEEEIITDVVLTFTPMDGGDVVTARAQDPDGEGVLPLQILDDINLVESTEYRLTVELTNSIEGEDITEEIREEADEHMFFFAFSDDLIRSPEGNGNADNRDDAINYVDFDGNGLPVGLTTDWTTICTEEDLTGGSFRIVLKHQPDIKSATSTITDGGTDIDLTFVMNVANDADAPACENEEEIITDVVLTFTPMDGGDVVTARAQDPDGEGVLPLQILDDINLVESTEYRLTVELTNSIEGEDITEEVREEADEHMFFYAFSDDLIRSPEGDGNADNRDDAINYVDFDGNGLPVGLTTDWTTICTEEDLTGGSFRIVLKHQPDIKSATSTITDGGTDIDLTFVMNVANDADAPACENEEEIITDVVLTFTPMDGGDVVTARAQDPDGEGVLPLQILDDINLERSKSYTLGITLTNAIEGEDITEEIREEDDEHMFFFAFTEGIFSDPEGDGNADNRDDAINYVDFDGNGLPVGLSTEWTMADILQSGTFRVVLKHQPDIKSATSTIADGGTDIDLTWNINSVVTSTKEVLTGTNAGFLVYPNPVRNDLQWTWKGVPSAAIEEIRVVDAMGRLAFITENTPQNISTSNWSAGTYFMQIVTRDAIHVQHFQKVK